MKERRGLLVLTQYYHPEPNFVTADVAQALAEHTPVTVITAHPNYPFGRFYPNTPFWRPTRRVENGVVVWRLPFFPSHSTSAVIRGFSYVSFVVMLMLFAPFIGGRPKTVWVYHTPFTTALVALWFKMMGARLIFTCADLWPESFSATGVVESGRVMDFMFAYSRWINRFADLLVCSTKSTLQRYLNDGIPEDRLTFIPVWVSGIPDPYDADTIGGGEKRSIVYAGNLGPAQDLETVVRAAAACVGRLDVQFDIYGVGAEEERLRALARTEGASNIFFHGRVTPTVAFRALEQAVGQIVALRRTALFRMTIPSKLYSAFAAGAPVLYALEGEAEDMVRQTESGFPYVAGDPKSMVSAIEALLNTDANTRFKMRIRLRRTYAHNYRASVLIGQYVALLRPDPLPTPGTNS